MFVLVSHCHVRMHDNHGIARLRHLLVPIINDGPRAASYSLHNRSWARSVNYFQLCVRREYVGFILVIGAGFSPDMSCWLVFVDSEVHLYDECYPETGYGSSQDPLRRSCRHWHQPLP